MLTYQSAIEFGMAIIFPMVIYFGVRTFHPPPKLNALRIHERQARQERFEEESRRHATILLLASASMGIAAIVCGSFIAISAIGAGLIFGGIFSLMNGYFQYWRYFENWIRFASLLAAFAVLVFVGYAKLAP